VKAAVPRIIAGRHRGRPLQVPAGLALRPTASRAREAAFDILQHGLAWPGLAGAGIVDVCAGTGAYGLEALSRGAGHATFIDNDQRALAAIQATAARLGESAAVTLLALDACRLPPPPVVAGAPLDLAFLDPPYRSDIAEAALSGLAARGWLRPGAIVLMEVADGMPAPVPPPFTLLDERTYGAARLVFLKVAGSG
jgi:16S rRNA (guanine966-N2)-methyltransferase